MLLLRPGRTPVQNTRMRRAALFALTVTALGAVSASLVGALPDDGDADAPPPTASRDSAGVPLSPRPVGVPPGPEPTATQTTPCDELTAPSRNTEVDTVHDSERGVIEFFFTDPGSGANRSFAIAYRDDPTCELDGRFADLIDHVLETTSQY